ncbi:MAG: hypothetical protein LBB25_00030, partial [Holosporaceae bacterium]|nr:hypothetical protein [Holosporaceae bacterium]
EAAGIFPLRMKRMLGYHMMKNFDCQPAVRIALKAMKAHPSPHVHKFGIAYTDDGIQKGESFWDWSFIDYSEAIKTAFFAVMRDTDFITDEIIKLPLFESCMEKFFFAEGEKDLTLNKIDPDPNNHALLQKRIALAMLKKVGFLEESK